MITPLSADPLLIASSALSSYRSRADMGERSLLPASVPATMKTSSASDNGKFPRHEPEQPKTPEPDQYGAASMFAAAVIAGQMPPVPTTMEELIMRIGTIPVPPESEARIRDLIA